MAAKYDADFLIGGNSPQAWLLAALLAQGKAEVLVATPRGPLVKDRSLVLADPVFLSGMNPSAPHRFEEIPGAAVSRLTLFKDRQSLGSYDFSNQGELRVITLDEILRNWESRDQETAGITRLEDLEIKSLKSDPSGVVAEGLSPVWSFKYRVRHAIIFPEHKELEFLVIKKGEPEGGPLGWLTGDFEDPSSWVGEIRLIKTPQGLLETCPMAKNVRRFILPMKSPPQAYSTETLRQRLPALTGLDLSSCRQVWEHSQIYYPQERFPIRTIGEKWTFLDTRSIQSPGIPGPWASFKEVGTLAQVLLKGLKSKSAADQLIHQWSMEPPGTSAAVSLERFAWTAGILGPLEGLRFKPLAEGVEKEIRGIV